MNLRKILVLASVVGMTLQVSTLYAQTASAPAPTSSHAANRLLAKKVRQALTQAKPMIPTEGIAVLAKSGAVTLVGEVESQDQADEAGKVAAAVSGVTSLKNNLGLSERGM
jgi:hyperosmotically inducible periplasmic protein